MCSFAILTGAVAPAEIKARLCHEKRGAGWEREFLMQKQADVNMSFESFVALYEKDVKPS